MLSASQQRQKDAEEMRARIDSERITLNRTTEMGQNGAKTWASEADSLRGRIAEFEAKLKRLKTQLTDMGFDENGVDIRAQAVQMGNDVPMHLNSSVDVDNSSGPLRSSSSGEELSDALKTSPIESTESCSSVGDTAEVCDDLAADLSRLLIFTAESQEMRAEVEDALELEKTTLSIGKKSEKVNDEANASGEAFCEPENILNLVRVATDELEQATNRMHEIREAREKAGCVVDEAINTNTEAEEASHMQSADGGDEAHESGEESTAKVSERDQSLEGTERHQPDPTLADVSSEERESESPDFPKGDAAEQLETEKPDVIPSIKVSKGKVEADTCKPFAQKVAHVLEEHNVVVERSRRLQKDAAAFSAKVTPLPSADEERETSTASGRDMSVDPNTRPHWYANAVTASSKSKKMNVPGPKGTKRHGKPPRGNTSTFADLSAATKALQGYGPAHLSSASRRRKEGTRSLDSINLDLAVDKRSLSSAGNESDALCSPSESNGSLKGTPRSVRFAELPPSYSASRTCENSREGSPVRNERRPDEKFVESVSRALQGRTENKDFESDSQSELNKEPSRGILPTQEEGPKDMGASLSVAKNTSKVQRSLRNDNQTAQTENGRQVAVSSQKPPRVRRNRSVHRANRSKEPMNRSFTSRHQSAIVGQSEKPFSKRSVSADAIGFLKKPPSKDEVGKVVEYDSFEDLGVTRVQERSPTRAPEEGPRDAQAENDSSAVDIETRLPQESDEELVENRGSGMKETVQKKLFLTPDSAVSSSKSTRHLSRLARRTSTGVLHSVNQQANSSVHSAPMHCDVTAVVKDSSGEFPSTDEEELLFSPTTKPAMSERSFNGKAGSGGFFAGQTAEWHESVRARSTLGGRSNVRGTGREQSDSSSRRNSGRTSTGVRSKVQALRARLAALK